MKKFLLIPIFIASLAMLLVMLNIISLISHR
jgi:hypothetical protein